MAVTYHHIVGRLCYTGSIFTPYIPPKSTEEKAKWGATLLINKEDAKTDQAFAAFKSDILDTGTAEFGAGAVVDRRPNFEVPALKNGDFEDEDFKHGYWVVKADSKWAIKVLGPDNNEISAGSPTADQLVYDGQHVLFRVRLDAWTYMKKKGVSARLQGIKILGGGKRESYGGGDSAAAMAAVDVTLPPSMQAAAKEALEESKAALAGRAPAPATTDGFDDDAPENDPKHDHLKNDKGEIPW